MGFRRVSGHGPTIGWQIPVPNQGPRLSLGGFRFGSTSSGAETAACTSLRLASLAAAGVAADASARAAKYLLDAMSGLTDFNSKEYAQLLQDAADAAVDAAKAAAEYATTCLL